MKNWICEFPLRAVQSVLIPARTKREALEKLKKLYDGDTDVDYEPLDIDYTRTGLGRVVGEDKKR